MTADHKSGAVKHQDLEIKYLDSVHFTPSKTFQFLDSKT